MNYLKLKNGWGERDQEGGIGRSGAHPPPPRDTPKLQLHIEQLSLQKTQRLKNSPSTMKDENKYIKKAILRQVGGVQKQSCQDPHSW